MNTPVGLKPPSAAGQYRLVKGTDDGCALYCCMWCDNMIEVRGSVDWWNFCPLCGKSWFKRLNCRPQDVPRWAWDRGTPNAYVPYKRPEWKWVLECRTKWFDDPWGEWEEDFSAQVQFGTLGAWRHAQVMLRMARARHDDDDNAGVLFQYRIQKEKLPGTW